MSHDGQYSDPPAMHGLNVYEEDHIFQETESLAGADDTEILRTFESEAKTVLKKNDEESQRMSLMLESIKLFHKRKNYYPTSEEILVDLEEKLKNRSDAWKLAVLFAKHCYVFGLGHSETGLMLNRLLAIHVTGPNSFHEEMIDPLLTGDNLQGSHGDVYDVTSAPDVARVQVLAPPNQTPTEFIETRAQVPMTGQCQGYVGSLEHFEGLKDVYYAFSNGASGLAHEDLEIRQDAPAQRRCVQQLFEAIMDMSSSIEAADDVNTDPGQDGEPAAASGNAVAAALRPRNKRRIGDILGSHGLTNTEKIEGLIGRMLSDLDIEVLCWEVLEAAIRAQEGLHKVARWQTELMKDRFASFEARWNSICEALRAHKLILQSLGQISWVERVAAAPHKEQVRKTANKKCNMVKTLQNKAGADAIKTNTRNGQWSIDERLGITDATGATLFQSTVRGSRGLANIRPSQTQGPEPKRRRVE
ncbi:hypothetical protein D7B24_001796 [Verticillium nonalfalfae]|uniref:Uncharacterized protein n=1 Tax=Verticillium nonalfalfae TaxID=1051616 RepID=A0A3M9YHU1_9PEZI|nr:uncharacterized protein D7B24_001796 [Verticillium nonalfalfae]RNJ59621.1 hypothetical protein D7B24_001796 [Verticillium nonalfalfae]